MTPYNKSIPLQVRRTVGRKNMKRIIYISKNTKKANNIFELINNPIALCEMTDQYFPHSLPLPFHRILKHLFVDNWFAKTETSGARDVEYKNAFFIGLFQVIAMIPGVSRSAATIIGGLTQKLNRTTAAEVSFFLAVPTMLAATGYKMLKYHLKVGFNSSDISILLIGNVVAFVVAIIAIKEFIGFLTKYGFKLFGWYRIIVGAAILILYAMGYQLQII
jgi:3-hydroxymyristoyl/3-hydroxydecanoyl-(acyl carrier protein) dehydratase